VPDPDTSDKTPAGTRYAQEIVDTAWVVVVELDKEAQWVHTSQAGTFRIANRAPEVAYFDAKSGAERLAEKLRKLAGLANVSTRTP